MPPDLAFRFAISPLTRSELLGKAEKDVYLYKNHPIRKVEVFGLIVGVDERPAAVSYLVDDGSGIIPCLYWFPRSQLYETNRNVHQLGNLVRVTGRVSEFKGQRQITINNIYVENNVNLEPLFWAEVLELKQTVYNVPFRLPPNIQDEIVTRTLRASQDSSKKVAVDSTEEQDKMTQNVMDRPEIHMSDLVTSIRLFVEAHEMGEVFFREVLKEPVLVGIAKKPMKETEVNDHSKSTVHMRFSCAFLELVKEGVMYQKREAEDLYEIIGHDLNLGRDLLRIIQEEAASGYSGEDGILEETLILKLRLMQRYKCIPRAKVAQSLALLVESSDIYEVGYKHYKCLV
ncbi:CST complex subunit STN1 [Quaeritorhiza haematococci]|nr:CST complex subunit STN1 [Quaeritorhiza haematococci]